MIIEVNVDSLIDHRMSACQYVMLVLLFEGKYNTLDTYIKGNDRLIKEIKDLMDKGYILSYKEGSPSNDIIFDKVKTQKLVGLSDSCFWELFSIYPLKVPSGYGGTRSLRPVSLDAKETKECKKKYEAYIGKRNANQKHAHVIRCLKAEMWMRNKSNQTQFMSELKTYINKQGWQKYEYLLELSNKTTAKTNKYGEDLI